MSAAHVELFDGVSLAGWHAAPRLPVPSRPGGPAPDLDGAAARAAAATSGRWSVRDGAIVGEQEVRGLGGYLVTDAEFGDVELSLEVRPDWPADTGVLLRATPEGTTGFQVLIDHRRSGSIGGFYGNGLAGFHAVSFAVDARYDAAGAPVGLRADDPATTLEPLTPAKGALLTRAATAEEFLRAWRFDDWNRIRVRCVGELPVLTTWVNDVLIAELDTAAIDWPGYDAEAVRRLLGPRGRIALEVHDNDPGMGDARWAPGAAVRWRRLRVTPLGG